MSLPPLSVRISADTSELQAGVRQAGQAVTELSEDAQAAGGGLSSFGATMGRVAGIAAGLAAGVAAAGAATAAFVRGQTNAADEIGKNARAVGISTDAYQALGFAMGQIAGVTQDQLQASLLRLNRVIGQAATGGDDQAAALRRIGFSAEEIESGVITADQALTRLTSHLGQMESTAEAAAIATELLGRSGERLGPLLQASGDQVEALQDRFRELELGFSEEMIAQAEAFNDQWDEMSRQFSTLAGQIAEVLMPAFQAFMSFTQDHIIPGLRALGGWIRGDGAAAFTQLAGFFNDHILPAFQGFQEWAEANMLPTLEAFAELAELVLLPALRLIWEGVRDYLLPILGAVAGLMLGAWREAFLGLAAVARTLGNFFSGAADAFSAAGDVIGGVIDWVVQRFNDLLGIIQTVATALGSVGDAIAGVFAPSQPRSTPLTRAIGGQDAGTAGAITGGVMRGLPGALGDAEISAYLAGLDTGQAIGAGVTAGVEAATGASVDAVGGQVEAIIGRAREDLGIQSPSRVFHEIGEFIGQGLAEGIESTRDMVSAAVGTLTEGAMSSTGEMVQSVLGSLQTLFRGSQSVSAAIATINTLVGITEALRLPFPANLAAAARVAAQGFAAVRGIQQAKPGGGAGALGAAAGGGMASLPMQRVMINFQGPDSARNSFAEFVDMMNEAGRRGYRVEGIVA